MTSPLSPHPILYFSYVTLHNLNNLQRVPTYPTTMPILLSLAPLQENSPPLPVLRSSTLSPPLHPTPSILLRTPIHTYLLSNYLTPYIFLLNKTFLCYYGITTRPPHLPHQLLQRPPPLLLPLLHVPLLPTLATPAYLLTHPLNIHPCSSLLPSPRSSRSPFLPSILPPPPSSSPLLPPTPTAPIATGPPLVLLFYFSNVRSFVRPSVRPSVRL